MKNFQEAYKQLNLKEIANGLTKYRLSLEIAFASGLGSFALNYHNLYVINSINTPYVLSSIAQGLASLMALLFVIIFFLCQSTGRVSILSQILNPDGYILLGVFLLGILFPLFALRIVYIEVLTDVSIGLATLCFVMLFPFISTINSKMKDFGIRNIVADLEVSRYTNSRLKYAELVDDLLNIGAKEIINLEPIVVVNALIEELSRWMEDEIINLSKKEIAMDLLVQIGFLTKEKDEELFEKAKIKISNMLVSNSNSTNLKEHKLSKISLDGFTKLMKKLQSQKKVDKDLRLYSSQVFAQALYKIFGELRALKQEGKTNDRLIEYRDQLLANVKLFIKEKIIYKKDLKEIIISRKGLSSISGSSRGLTDKTRNEFKKYMEDFLGLDLNI